MSQSDDRQEVFKCLKLGAADYLVKPLRVQELRNIWTRAWWHQVCPCCGLEWARISAAICILR